MFFSRRKPPNPDPPPVGSHDRRFRGLFAGVPLIIGLVTVSVIVLLIFLNARWMGEVRACRHYYPNATVVAEQQPYFLQPFGQLTTDLTSPDTPDVVEGWYNREYGAAMRAAQESGDLTQITPVTWSVYPGDDGGSRIFMLCP
jgi:hypothetical protein